MRKNKKKEPASDELGDSAADLQSSNVQVADASLESVPDPNVKTAAEEAADKSSDAVTTSFSVGDVSSVVSVEISASISEKEQLGDLSSRLMDKFGFSINIVTMASLNGHRLIVLRCDQQNAADSLTRGDTVILVPKLWLGYKTSAGSADKWLNGGSKTSTSSNVAIFASLISVQDLRNITNIFSDENIPE